MNTVPLRRIALLALFLSVPVALAQEGAPKAPAEPGKAAAGPGKKGPEMDEGARKVWDAWKKKSYHLSRTGLKRASFKISVSIAHPAGKQEGAGTYTWDGKAGSVKWDNAMIDQMMSQGGKGSAETFNRWFQKDHMEAGLETVKIRSEADSEGMKLTVDGKSESGVSAMHFDAEGVMRKISIRMERPGMGEMTGSLEFSYAKLDDKFLGTGHTGRIKTPMGEMDIDSVVTFETKGDYRVPVSMVRSMSLGGQVLNSVTMKFAEWKFDDDVK